MLVQRGGLQKVALWCGGAVMSCSVVLSLPAVHQWGTEEVAAWLELICLTEYKEIFIGHDVRGAELLQLERRDLKVWPSV